MLSLQSLDRRDCCVEVREGSSCYLGRGKGSGIVDSTVSSKHATISTLRCSDGSLVLNVTAKDPVRIKLPGKDTVAKLLPGTSIQVWNPTLVISSPSCLLPPSSPTSLQIFHSSSHACFVSYGLAMQQHMHSQSQSDRRHACLNILVHYSC